MLKREDQHLRVPSAVVVARTPVAARRSLAQNTHTAHAWTEDNMEPRARQRDPSPGGLGRLSTSAPNEDNYFNWSRRYRELRSGSADREASPGFTGRARNLQRPFSDPFESGGAYATMPGFRRSREPSPRNSRVTMSTSLPPSAAYMNGDAALDLLSRGDRRGNNYGPESAAYRGTFRPKSFPDQRGTYLYEPPRQHEYGYSHESRHHDSLAENRHRSRGQIQFQGQSQSHGQSLSLHAAGSSALSAAHSAGSSSVSGASSRSTGEASPISDEAMSSVTLTAERAMAERRESGMYEEEETGLYSLLVALSCYLCGHPFRRPRILPCGHTFCSECLAQLKEETLRDGRPVSGSPCTVESRHKPDLGVQFVCPMPECRYSMRLMNLGRWSTRNKTVSDAVSALRSAVENKQDAEVQTDITMDSMLVTIPRSLIEETPPPGADRSLVRRNSSSLVDRMVHRALSMDSLSNNYYIPRQHVTWKSYVAMLGMHILQQVMHT